MVENARFFHDHRASENVLRHRILNIINASATAFVVSTTSFGSKRENSILAGTSAEFLQSPAMKRRLLNAVISYYPKPGLSTPCGALVSKRMTPTLIIPACGEQSTCSGKLFLPSTIPFATMPTGRDTPPLFLNYAL